MKILCQNTKDCKIYQEWSKQTNNSQIDVIMKDEDYHCLALDSFTRKNNAPLLKDDSGLKKLVSNLFTTECYNIELLNNVD